MIFKNCLFCLAFFLLINRIACNKNSYYHAKQNLKKLQHQLDITNSRSQQVGNMGWLVLMPIYLHSLVFENDEFKNVCQVGFGVGHSTTVILSASETVKVYTFDIFPQNTSVTNVEMRDFMPYLPASQTAGRKYIDIAFPGEAYHKN